MHHRRLQSMLYPAEDGSRGRMREYARRRKHLLIEGGLSLTLVVAVLAGAFAWANVQAARNMESLGDPFAALPVRPTEPEPAPASGGRSPVNILLVGSDSPVGGGDPAEWEEVSGRTDAVMLLHLPADRERLYAMSIPRDSWVRLPGHGEGRVSAAFARGGPSLLIHSVEELTGMRIDHIAVSDFDSFARLTDHLDGVMITVPETTYNSALREAVPAGTYRMDGEQAEHYVRQRHGLPGEDLDRIRRQQNWLRSIGQEVMDRNVLHNPLELNALLTTLTQSLAVDDGLTVTRLVELVWSARSIDEKKDLVFFTAPISGTSTSDEGQTITWLDRTGLTEVSAAMTENRLPTYLAQNGDEVQVLGDRVN